jgi:hypothetical protein
MPGVCQFAIDVAVVSLLAGSGSNADLARLIFRNVIGVEASAETVDVLTGYMDGRIASFSQADFVAAVAGLELNEQHIGLVGLQATGIEFD